MELLSFVTKCKGCCEKWHQIDYSLDKPKSPFTRDRIKMGWDSLGSGPFLRGVLTGSEPELFTFYTGSDPFGFYELLAAL